MTHIYMHMYSLNLGVLIALIWEKVICFFVMSVCPLLCYPIPPSPRLLHKLQCAIHSLPVNTGMTRTRWRDVIGSGRTVISNWISCNFVIRFHVYHLLLDIKDEEDETFLKVQGPCCACRCCTEMNFDVSCFNYKSNSNVLHSITSIIQRIQSRVPRKVA